MEELARVGYTDADVFTLADELGVDRSVALDRVNDWARALNQTVASRIKEQLASVIADNQPAHP